MDNNTNNAERALRYLQGVKEASKRLDALNKMIEHENQAGNLHRRRVLEASYDAAQKKLDDASLLLDRLGTIEGDMLKNLYVFGYTGEETAKITGYSEPRVWELARSGRKKLAEMLPDSGSTIAS